MAEIRGRMTLYGRIAAAGALLFLEKLVLNFFVDTNVAAYSSGFGESVRNAQHWGFRGLVTFAAAVALFGYVRGDAQLKSINLETRGEPLRIRWLALHAALFVPLAALTFSFYGNHGLAWPMGLLAALWLLAASAALLALFAALAPWRIWREAAATLGALWLYAAAAAIVATAATQWSQMLWAPTTQITFRMVDLVLQPLLPALHSNAVTDVLDTGRFAVEVYL